MGFRPFRLQARLLQPRLLAAGILFFLLLPACTSSAPPVQEDTSASGDAALQEFMDTSPREGRLVFLGVAGIRSRIQESVDLALEEAARRVAIFREVEGEFSTLSAKGGRLLDYRAESTASLRFDTAYKDYLETLEFDENSDVMRIENAIFVRVRYPGSLDLPYLPSGPGKPFWIENPPATIGEYIVGVGYADRRDAHRDTVIASYENAVFSIIRDLSAVSSGQNIDYRGEGFLDISFTSQQGIDAKGSLMGFYALETWTDPVDKSVWTLAIAKGSVF
jgi:hypothetical protein